MLELKDPLRILVPSRFRFLFFVLVLLFVWAALFPFVALLPFRDDVLTTRDPEMTVRAAQVLFIAAAVGFGIISVFWRASVASVVAAVNRIVALSTYQFWVLLFGLASFLRILVAFGLPYQPTGDAEWYHMTARALAVGQGLMYDGKLTAYRPPGYSFLLSLSYRLFGTNYNFAWLWGTIATIVIILTTYYIAWRRYGIAAARLATLTIGVYPALVFLTGQTMSDLVFVAGLLLLIAFVLWSSPLSLWHTTIIGICLGLLALTRSVALGLIGVIPMIWFLQRVEIRKLLVASILLFGVCLIVLTPWALRNLIDLGKLTLGTNLGINAYVGNHPGASGGYGFGDLSFVPPNLDEVELDAVLFHQAVDFIVSHPLETVLLIPRKLVHLYLLETSVLSALYPGVRVYPAWVKYGLYGIAQMSYVLVLLLFGFRSINLFGDAKRPVEIQWTSWLLISYFTLTSLIFFGADRFRLPILPWMAIEGSVLLARIPELAREIGDRPSMLFSERQAMKGSGHHTS